MQYTQYYMHYRYVTSHQVNSAWPSLRGYGRNEHQPKGGDALRLGSEGRYGSCVGGR